MRNLATLEKTEGAISLVLFRCEARALSLTPQRCAQQWQDAQNHRPDAWQGNWHCRACAIGAARAGKTLPSHGDDALRNTCPRCFRLSDRLIGGALCVSCYNREREAKRGRNAKGTVPRIAAKLHPETVAVVQGPRRSILHYDSVVGRDEAIMRAYRAMGPLALCSTWQPPVGAQLELPL